MARKSKRYLRETLTVCDAIVFAVSVVDDLKCELDEWLNNMPENLQESDRAEAIREAMDTLDNSEVDGVEVPAGLADVSFSFTNDKRARSRAERLRNAINALDALIEAIPDELEHDEDTIYFEGEVQNVIGELENVEFPRAFG